MMEQNIKPYGGAAAAAAISLATITFSIVSSSLQSLFSTSPTAFLLAEKRRHLRSLLPLLLRFLFRLAIIILSPLLALLASLHPPRFPTSTSPASPAAARALEHVLALLSRVPVASRKYDILRSLADRLLDDNLSFSCELEALNRVALSNAFSLMLRRLEVAVAAAVGSGAGDGSLDLIMGAVKSGLRRLSTTEEAMTPEKLAAELLWMAGKMEACGAAGEAVARWGEAAELGRIAISAEPRLQAPLVKLSVFLFKHLIEEKDGGGEEDDEENFITHRRMAMLTSWLPLLCHASNGADAPMLSSKEKAEMVGGLERLIHKLSWEHQEEVLSLWLHHFATCSDSDWPNLESCYTQWYAESRKLLPCYTQWYAESRKLLLN